MKHLNLLSGIIIGVGFCLLISANSKTTSINEDVPRYHVSFGGTGTGFAYDAVTGDYKLASSKQIGMAGNIKTLLGK